MSTLGNNIKVLRKKNSFSQSKLAEALGVSQTSIAHYEAGTRQPTIETLIQIAQLFHKSIDNLVGNNTSLKATTKKMEQEELIETLLSHLLNKNESGFIELFEKDVYPSYDIDYIVDFILKEIMYRIGTLWEQGNISEADEHYATNIVRKVNNYVSIKSNKAIKNRKAVSFTTGAEQHSLGIEMVNTFLESEGVESIYIGSNVPINSIEKAIAENKPNYIFVSVTLKDNMNSLTH